MKYVALLRGINVGGNRKVPMAELREVFVQMGFSDVSTYINSGNVIFCSRTVLEQNDKQRVEEALEGWFGFRVETLIISAEDIIRTARAIPTEWTNDYVQDKSDVCYLFSDVDSSDALEMISPNPNVETIMYIKGAILSTISRKNQSKSSLAKLVGTPFYRRMTIRNITTARKLAELVAR